MALWKGVDKKVKDGFSTIGLEEIYDNLKELIIEIENEFEIDVLCGLVEGGRAMALSSGKSDMDFNLYYSLRGLKRPDKKYKNNIVIQGRSMDVEICLIEINDLKKGGRKVFDKKDIAYPSILYRSEEEERRYMPDSILPREERDDFYFSKYYWLTMGDSIWLSNRMKITDYEKFYNYQHTIDVLDYYYTYAYGNWIYYVSKEHVINLKRYLDCIWQILSCDWILRFRHRPPNNFRKLYSHLILEETLKERIYDLYSTNCNSNMEKSKLYCRPDSIINVYIYQSLMHQRTLIEAYDSNETVKILIDNTPKEYQKKILIN